MHAVRSTRPQNSTEVSFMTRCLGSWLRLRKLFVGGLMTPDEFSPLQQIRLFLTVERDWLWMARAGRGPRSAPHCSLGHEGDADDSLARLRPHQAARLLPERAVMGRVKAASSSSPSGSMMTDWGRRWHSYIANRIAAVRSANSPPHMLRASLTTQRPHRSCPMNRQEPAAVAALMSC